MPPPADETPPAHILDTFKLLHLGSSPQKKKRVPQQKDSDLILTCFDYHDEKPLYAINKNESGGGII
jgi:hypothetical protein